MYLCKIKKFHNRKIKEQNFNNPKPRLAAKEAPKLRIAGPCITNVFATRRKNFSQWHRSFQRENPPVTGGKAVPRHDIECLWTTENRRHKARSTSSRSCMTFNAKHLQIGEWPPTLDKCIFLKWKLRYFVSILQGVYSLYPVTPAKPTRDRQKP